jgi:hypothetical protein
MADDFVGLSATIRRVCPNDELERMTEAQANAIRRGHPGVPDHYLAFLREVGWGSLGSSLMLYSGLIEPDEVFDTETAGGLKGLLFFGDNFSGDMVGFDTRCGWRIVELYHASLRVFPSETRTIAEFVADWIADWDD